MADITPQDKGEYDYEGDMAKSQLKSIIANATRLHDMLKPESNLPEWVQSKITLAEDYILTSSNYMEGEMNEEVEQVDEVKKSLSPGWMLRADPPLAKKLKAKQDLAKQRQKAYGNPKAGVSVKSEEMKPYVKAAQAKFDAQTKAQNKGKKQAGTLAAKKEREQEKSASVAQKTLDIVKGKKNKVNMKPEIEGEKNANL